MVSTVLITCDPGIVHNMYLYNSANGKGVPTRFKQSRVGRDVTGKIPWTNNILLVHGKYPLQLPTMSRSRPIRQSSSCGKSKNPNFLSISITTNHRKWSISTTCNETGTDSSDASAGLTFVCIRFRVVCT
jgi:hypothetical protein